MTAFFEEQSNELEAVEAIFCNEITVIVAQKKKKVKLLLLICFVKQVHWPAGELQLTFTYPDKYPEEIPDIQITLDSDLCDESDEEELFSMLKNEANNNLGMVMILTLVSCATEWLNTRSEEIKERTKNEIERKIREQEEAEFKRFEGTRVTVETFLRWKKEFEHETTLLESKQITDVCNKRLTGKELFEKDHTLNESDLSFLNEEGDDLEIEAVTVDESLFQDLDDLDINELSDN
ncbi:hypothetical protein B4U80_05501 [Leptotrombidium deliense]|uniref:RWD domain-containing protein n=1 Tax=Leptotrombidium deliense TaxID=299467 RepID=A0A443SDW9_9ACAR|nr:hypothetical protein B4U80_05501 [Leptotrombidium deliense]